MSSLRGNQFLTVALPVIGCQRFQKRLRFFVVVCSGKVVEVTMSQRCDVIGCFALSPPVGPWAGRYALVHLQKKPSAYRVQSEREDPVSPPVECAGNAETGDEDVTKSSTVFGFLVRL